MSETRTTGRRRGGEDAMSETRTTGRRQGGEGEVALWSLAPGYQEGWFWESAQVSGRGAASAAQPLAPPPPLPPLAESACCCARYTLVGSLPAPPSALPLPSRVASGDCSEKQVCMPVLPRLSLLNPFITALVQESGLSEVGMNN